MLHRDGGAAPATITATPINCTLNRNGGRASNTDALEVPAHAVGAQGMAVSDALRIADHEVLPGVPSDEGDDDARPALRERSLAHDILILADRMDRPDRQHRATDGRVPGRTDDAGRMPGYGKPGATAILGNEDGAHWSTAQLIQSPNDTGWIIPAVVACYRDLNETPNTVADIARAVANNAAHLAGPLKGEPHPGWWESIAPPCLPPRSGAGAFVARDGAARRFPVMKRASPESSTAPDQVRGDGMGRCSAGLRAD